MEFLMFIPVIAAALVALRDIAASLDDQSRELAGNDSVARG